MPSNHCSAAASPSSHRHLPSFPLWMSPEALCAPEGATPSSGYSQRTEKLPSKGCGRGGLQTAPAPTPRGTSLVGKHEAKHSQCSRKSPADSPSEAPTPTEPHPCCFRAALVPLGHGHGISKMKCFHFWHCPGFTGSVFNHQNQILSVSIHRGSRTITGQLYCQSSFLWD